MRDQLRQLEELQTHDAKIQELEQSLKAIPAKIAATELDLARVEALLTSEGSALKETERYYAEQKGLVTDDEVQVAGAKHKLDAGQELERVHGGAEGDRAATREHGLARGRDRQARRGRRGQEEAADRSLDRRAGAPGVHRQGRRGRPHAHGRDRGQDRRAARRARQAGRRRQAGRPQALRRHPDAPRPGASSASRTAPVRAAT